MFGILHIRRRLVFCHLMSFLRQIGFVVRSAWLRRENTFRQQMSSHRCLRASIGKCGPGGYTNAAWGYFGREGIMHEPLRCSPLPRAWADPMLKKTLFTPRGLCHEQIVMPRQSALMMLFDEATLQADVLLRRSFWRVG